MQNMDEKQVDILIFKAEEAHLDAIAELYRQVAFHIMNKKVKQWENLYPNRENLLQEIREGSVFIALEATSKTLMSCVILDQNPNLDYAAVSWKYKEVKPAVLQHLVVHPEYESKGIGRKVLSYVEGIAREAKFRTIRIEISCENKRAIEFFKKLQYVIAGTAQVKGRKFHYCEKSLY